MSKKKLAVKMVSYGIYSQWESESKDLPVIQEFTNKIPARLGIEFGYILNIKKGRGQLLQYRIDHPPFNNSVGESAGPFLGEIFIRSSDFNFFLGDTVWEPIAEKCGKWTLTTYWQDNIIAEKTLELVESI